MRNKVYRVVSLTLLLSVLAAIFYLSQQDGTKSGESSGLIMRLLESLFNREFDEGIVREGAHFTEYLVLGVMTVNFGYAYRRYLQPLLSLFFGAIYALSDEIHQIFIPGRACQLFDLAVDTSGVLCGVLLFSLIAVPIIQKKKRGKTLC